VTGYVCTISVADLDTTVGKVPGAGGSIILARMPVKGIGWWASCRDTEGNLFGMMQEDQNAG
jgi:predicted enzyme related to lactoylglutathione lyase